MANNEHNQKMLSEIKQCVDMLDIEGLWGLSLIDAKGVFNKISVRQLGVRRLEKLYAYLKALDRKELYQRHSFELLLMNCVEIEIGVGLFAKKKR